MSAVQPYGYDPSPWHRLWRILTADFSLGTWFSVHVRMYWAAVILMPLVFLQRVPSASPGEAILLTTICFVGLFAIIWTHEMGHIAAAWRYHIRTSKITLGPLGGLAHLNAPAKTPKEDIWISLAGPAVHLLWLLVLWPIEWLLTDVAYATSWYGFAVWYLVTTNQVLLLFNLLPIFPLDGGRVLRALLAMKYHPNRATIWAANVGIVGGVVIALGAMTQASAASSIGFIIGLSCVLASINEKRAARHILIYGATQRDPWETDPDAWKHGGDGHDDEGQERKPGWLAQRRAVRAQQIAAASSQAAADQEAQVDAILERVSQVGMSGLTEQEKNILQQASKKRRGAG
ncbi:MAG: Zn-dependent protease [Hyphomicrobiaceae bacterium]|jgi:Zn-dependent protease